MATEADAASEYDPNLAPHLVAEAARLIQAFSFAGGHLVIVGGLVPGLLVPKLEEGFDAHVGTRDLDLCLSVALVEGNVGDYDRLETSLKGAGFKMARDEGGNSMSWRWVGGASAQITVEFFCPVTEERRPGTLYRPGGVVGGKLSALTLAAGNLVDADTVERTVTVNLPDGGGRADITMRVVHLAGYLATKADALKGRVKNKDAYDIVWLLEAWPGGFSAAAQVVKASRIFADEQFKNSLGELSKQFADIDAVGSRRYARFMKGEGADPGNLARRAAGAVKAFLDALNAPASRT